MLPLLSKERVGVRFKELSTLIEMLPKSTGLFSIKANINKDRVKCGTPSLYLGISCYY
jgi:hypothetical protein